MNIDKPKRDYKKEAQRDKELNKKYLIRVPIYLAKAFEEKLAKDKKGQTEFFHESIEKYLKKSWFILQKSWKSYSRYGIIYM